MFKSISSKKIYDNSSISFVFEFFTPLEKRIASAKFSKALGKKIKWFTDANSSYEATFETFKIAPIYSNGYKEISLSTGFLPYQDGIHMLLKIMNIIESIGHTTSRCSVTTKIRLNEKALDLPIKIDKLNKLKYLLGLDESKMFELWPVNENDNIRVYQNNLRFIQPKDLYNTIITENYVERMNPIEFNLPESEFFANNFSELGQGQLVINYISGKDYTKKKKEAVETINIIIEHLYNTLAENYTYTVSEKKKIVNIVYEFKKSIVGTRSYLNFKSTYPDISIYMDLTPNKYLIEANYPIIRDSLFKLIVGGGITEAIINYDTQRKAIQIKDAKITKSILVENLEFYQCEVEADANNCLFEGCTIKNSKLTNSTVFSNNVIRNSKIINCNYLGENNSIKSSYLDNSENLMINAELQECLVNNGKFTLSSKIDSKTKIINNKK